jgi:hypothetical protein
LIDYLLCEHAQMLNITKFSSGKFNTLSAHAPICFTLLVPGLFEPNQTPQHIDTGRTPCKSVRWNEDNTQSIIDSLTDHISDLQGCLGQALQSQGDVNMCVDSFCNILSNCVLPLCNVYTNDVNANSKNNVKKTDQPWFNETCKRRFNEYKSAIYNFNKCKSKTTHETLVHKKSLYKKLANKCKRQYMRFEGNMMNQLRKNSPKQFYKLFAKRKQKAAKSNITSDQFLEHFRDVSTSMGQDTTDDNYDTSQIQTSVYDELDATISIQEIEKAIKNLKSDKSCAEDCIINEVFIKCKDVLLPCLYTLFNSVFESGLFPESWTTRCIVLVFKKGDINDPNNYRGITIVSCLGKLFTSILNNRLLIWDSDNDIITDAQFGFKPGASTVDAIFVLQSLINRTLKKKRRLYCCFVDYQKAFDFIDRSSLWSKLVNLGIQGKMFKIIKSLYENVKSCVKYNGCLSEYFRNTRGLLQGEVLSPILFSFYINDFEMCFIRENCPSVELQLVNIFLLMYADDTVLISETPDGLQSMLDALYSYTKEWNLTVNIDKTKILVFRNGGKVNDKEKWTYDGKNLEIVNTFNYLGMLFNFNGKFSKTQKHIADQGRKALFAITSKLKQCNFNIETKCSVFDTYVNSILCYAAEIWGFHKALDVEKVHISFCKNVLGVKTSTSNNLVYYELGRLPLRYVRKIRIIKFWLKLKSTDNCILRACYQEMISNKDDWIVEIQSELENIGLGYMFENYINMTDNCIIGIIKCRLRDIYTQSMMTDISNSSKGLLFQHLVDNFTLQNYLCKPINPLYRKYISRFRMSSHKLRIEQGRYSNENRNSRVCTICDSKEIEDEFHFILKCPFYSTLRDQYIKKYYYQRPSVFKLVKLLSTNNVGELCKLGKYLYLASKKRLTV